jgi:hypothetical protein
MLDQILKFYTTMSQECFLQNFTLQYMKVIVANKQLYERNTQRLKNIEIS